MSAVKEVGSERFFIDRSTNTIRFERELKVSADELFRAWTEPEQVACWWDPTGAPLAACEIDLRVGGSFSFASNGHPDRPFSGVYRTIDRPNLLAFEAMGAEGRVEIKAAGGGTQMIVEIVCQSPEHLQQFVEMGVAIGTSRTLDNLVAYKSC
jgi:uncharacterized protein YndB with AHSA1/START domain